MGQHIQGNLIHVPTVLPTFIGIGAPKAGTTWLSRCLQEHPDVFMAAVKETNFFDYGTIENRWQEYQAHFVQGDGCVAVGEISTRYLASNDAPARIQKHLPHVRLFVSLRNPVDQVYSHYWHLLRQNFHQWERRHIPRSFEEALERYPEKLLQPAFYGKRLQHWLRYVEPSQLLTVFYDDLRAEPQQVLSLLYAFLGVDRGFMPPSIKQQGATVRRGVSPKPGLGRIYAILYDQLNRRFYYPCKQLVGTQAAARIKAILRVRELMEFLFLETGYPEMRPTTRAFLRGYFAEDVRHLSRLTERDLSGWA